MWVVLTLNFNKIVRFCKNLALGSKNDYIDLIRRFGSDRSAHQWYWLKSRKYKKEGGANLTFLEVTIVIKHIIQIRVLDMLN